MRAPEPIAAVDCAKQPAVKTRWWLGAILAPLLSPIVGIVVGLLRPQHDSDWIGVGFMIPFVTGISVGCVASVVCAIFSWFKKESRSGLAMLFGVPCFCVLAFAVFGLLAR